jgi:hypothetical protein
MNERDTELFEAELCKLAPARPPDELMARLATVVPQPVAIQSKAPFPLTPALSPRRGSPFRRAGKSSRASESSQMLAADSLSLGERVRVTGNSASNRTDKAQPSALHPPQFCPPSAVSLRRTGYGGRVNPQPLWQLLFRWLAPTAAAAALVAALLFWWPLAPGHRAPAKPPIASLNTAPKPDAIEIDLQLVALFDAVAELPSGQPVRFRCHEWADEVVFRDPARGLVIERRTPRLEVVPVSFETY